MKVGDSRAVKLKSFVFRKIEPRDANIFLSLRLEGLREAPLAFLQTYDEGLRIRSGNISERIRASLLRGDGFIVGAFSDQGELIGVLGLRRSLGEKVRHKGEVWGLYVTSAYRGVGVGSSLVEHVIRYARVMKGLEILQLTVVTENFAARSLFEKLGFSTYGVERRGLRSEGRFYDIALMSRLLP